MSDIIASDLQRGAIYSVFSSSTYFNLGGLGTAAIFMDEQPDGGVVFDAVPVGRFAIDVDHLNRVNTWVREWSATAQQIRDRFGDKDLPQDVRNALDRDDSSTEFNIIHAVTPRAKPSRAGHMFDSTWYPAGKSDEVLHQGGYFEFPALVPRWIAAPGDVYGRGPGWTALGNIRMLQHYNKALAKLLDLKLNPPKWSTNATPLSYLPGNTTHVAPKSGEKPEIGNVVEIKAEDIIAAREEIQRLERAIDETFYGHLWRSFTDDDRTGRTATEIEARKQELALLVGPLLESLNSELFEPLIERRYKMLMRRGVLPPLPESLQGVEMRVEFISIMHQMQQTVMANGVRVFLGDVQMLATMRPEAIDSINTDAVVEEFVRSSGVRAETIVPKDELEKIRAAKAQAEQAAQANEQAMQTSEAVRNVSGADPIQLQQVAGMLAPAAAAQGGASA